MNDCPITLLREMIFGGVELVFVVGPVPLVGGGELVFVVGPVPLVE